MTRGPVDLPHQCPYCLRMHNPVSPAAPRPEGPPTDRLTRALRVAAHSPHDQDGEPNEGFPVCSVCGAIQTDDDPEALAEADMARALYKARAAADEAAAPRPEGLVPDPAVQAWRDWQDTGAYRSETPIRDAFAAGWDAALAAAPRPEGLDADTRSAARAAHLFLNMGRCPDCHVSWPEGYVHPGCLSDTGDTPDGAS